MSDQTTTLQAPHLDMIKEEFADQAARDYGRNGLWDPPTKAQIIMLLVAEVEWLRKIEAAARDIESWVLANQTLSPGDIAHLRSALRAAH